MTDDFPTPGAFGEGSDIATSGSNASDSAKCCRELLWQQVWEHLVNECRIRAARHRDFADSRVSTPGVLRTHTAQDFDCVTGGDTLHVN